MLLQELLKEIDRNRSLLQARKEMKDIEKRMFDYYYRILNTYSSNSVEGNSLSLIETKLWLEEGLTAAGKTRNELNEADGHSKAFNVMLDIARKNSINVISNDLLDILTTLHRNLYELINPRSPGFTAITT
ncbi:MAG: hypothetical protein LBR80_08000 [Deltaproteobacteria bacterium]|jgi:Fic family protein|nr:hypothetical protein [Deltaproteobacteria bacterium]